jgi:tRNA(Ile)-lysidine synthase
MNHKKYLLAVSGGIDSMVMCDLFLHAGLPFSVAHCNFRLRGEESDGDELLVRTWCSANNIRFFAEQFDTQTYAGTHKLSVQVAARTLRYRYFEQVLTAEKFDFIATAHHQDDNIETVLFHFFRGTGIQGLTGIPLKNERIVRPLLHLAKSQIIAYAIDHCISYRNDSSNQKSTYTRNKLRNEIIPQLQDIFPAFKNNIAHNIGRLKEVHELYTQQIEQYRKQLTEQKGKDWYIPVLKLKKVRPLATVLYELIRPFHFNYDQCLQVIDLLESESGHRVENEQYFILKDRAFLIISARNTEASDTILIDQKTAFVQTADFELMLNLADAQDRVLIKDASIGQFDLSQLSFPLLLRKWRPGDYMYPLGMKKKKKIARILIDRKVALHEKENIWVLECNKKIIWLPGIITDERVKITPSTKDMLLIQFKKK